MFLQSNNIIKILALINKKVIINDYKNSNNSLYWWWTFKWKYIFFKLVKKDKWEFIKNNTIEFWKYFKTPNFLFSFDILEDFECLIFEYFDKNNFNIAHDYFNLLNFPSESKFRSIETFFINLYNISINSLSFKIVENYPSKVLYEDRLWKKRLDIFYWKSFSFLLNDINTYSPLKYDIIYNYLLNYRNIILSTKTTYFSINHWDLHDFNYWFYFNETINDMQNIFFDLDTIWDNPILSDFACYYWYLIYQADNLLIKYKKEFYQWKNWIDYIFREKIINLYIENYFKPLIKKLSINKEFYWKKELWWRLVLRVLWVDNILKYSNYDRKKIYEIVENIIIWSNTSNNKLDLPFIN